MYLINFVLILVCSALAVSPEPLSVQDAMGKAVSTFRAESDVTLLSTNRHNKRQAVMTRAIQAVYTYSCPHAENVRRLFSWEATYTVGTHDLKLKSVDNIDSWGKLLTIENAFSAFWYHQYCVPHYDMICRYKIQGYTQGSVTYYGIIMELVTESNLEPLLPKVVESCTEPGMHNSRTCGIEASKAAVCDITNIAVHVIN